MYFKLNMQKGELPVRMWHGGTENIIKTVVR